MPTDSKDRSELINSVALLVIDAQDCFIDTLHDKTGFMSRCSFAIDAARSLGITTLFTEQVPTKLGHTNAKLLRRAQAPKLFHKESFSALSSPGIEEFLRDNEIYHLLVCGLETPICIYQTGLQAVDEDIDVTFLVDALGCRRAEDAAYAIEALRRLGCQVLPSETVFYSLIGEATHPAFRALTDLVKTYAQSEFDIESYLDKATEARSAPRQENRRDDQGNGQKAGDEQPKRRRSRNSRRGRRRESSDFQTTESPDQTVEKPSSKDAVVATPQPVEATPVERKPNPRAIRDNTIVEKKSASRRKKEKATSEAPKADTPITRADSVPTEKIAKEATKKVARKRAPRKTAKKLAKQTIPSDKTS